jgi:DNA anti-recombination protein RmuC
MTTESKVSDDIVERLRSCAQNNEMIDQYYTESGRAMNEAAELIESLQSRLDAEQKLRLDAISQFGQLQEALDAETLKRRQVEHERDAILKTLADAMSYARHSEGCSAALGSQYRCRCGYREFAALQGEVDADRVDRGSHEA